MANIWRRIPSGRIETSFLVKKKVGDYADLVADDFFEYTAPTDISLAADNGSYSVSGQDANLVSDIVFAADSGSFSLSGQDAGLNRVGVFSEGSFALSGQDALFSKITILEAANGSYSLAGQDASFSTEYSDVTMVAASGLVYLRFQDFNWQFKKGINRNRFAVKSGSKYTVR